eukprot:TRINITY_DN3175_c0_g1_i1.p1 TRINITY_DN3175_c0_g1~~TRINITY_DN3175_c0_g1_i1.p1  ORF type:complete len:624 (+),score=109.53 TRINITY_DN3175_c0_g1_i1:136-2007(+)
MTGLERFWSALKTELGSDPSLYEAYRQLLRVSADPGFAQRWWGARGGVDLQAALDAAPYDVLQVDTDEVQATRMELPRHPGDQWCDDEPEELPEDRSRQYVAVLPSNQIGSLTLCSAGGETVGAMRCLYPSQLRVSVEPQRFQLMYDFIEARPSARAGWSVPEPSVCDELRAQLSEFDAIDKACGPDGCEDRIFALQTLKEFRNARVLRMRIPLDDVCGVRLIVSPCMYTVGNPVELVDDEGESQGGVVHEINADRTYTVCTEDGELHSNCTSDTMRPRGSDFAAEFAAKSAALPGVLVLAFRSSPGPYAFAARCVNSDVPEHNAFAVTSDWTPDGAGGAATRHYITGASGQLRNIAAYMASIDPAVDAVVQGDSLNVLRVLPKVGADEDGGGLVSALAHRRAGRELLEPSKAPRLRRRRVWPCAERSLPDWGPVDRQEGEDEAIGAGALGSTSGKFALFGGAAWVDPEEEVPASDWDAPQGVPKRDYDPQFDQPPEDDFQFPHPEAEDSVLNAADRFLSADPMQVLAEMMQRREKDRFSATTSAPAAAAPAAAAPAAEAASEKPASPPRHTDPERASPPPAEELSGRDLERAMLSHYARGQTSVPRSRGGEVPDCWEEDLSD